MAMSVERMKKESEWFWRSTGLAIGVVSLGSDVSDVEDVRPDPDVLHREPQPEDDLHHRAPHAEVEEGHDAVAHAAQAPHERGVAFPDVEQGPQREPRAD